MSASGAREILVVILGISVICAYFGWQTFVVLLALYITFLIVGWLKFDWIDTLHCYNDRMEVLQHKGINCEKREKVLSDLEYSCNCFINKSPSNRWGARMLLNRVKCLTYEERKTIGDRLGLKVTIKK